MKVLFLTNIPSPYRVDFFNEFGKLCDLTVLFEKRKASNREWNVDNAIYYKEKYLTGILRWSDTAFCPSVIKFLSNNKYDHIIVGGYSTPTGMLAIEYMRLNKIPFILNCDGGMVKQDKRMYKKIKEHFISSACYWLSPSDYSTEYLVHYGAIKSKTFKFPFTSLKENDMSYCPTKHEREMNRKELGIVEEKIIIGVGQFIYRKGFDVLLNASIFLSKDIGVYIIGGEPTYEYNKFVNENKLINIHFVNFKDKRQLSLYYKAADIFVLPTREDIWGLVINEAMAYSLPIITTDRCVAGLELVQNDINGYIIPANDAKCLAIHVEKIINNTELRNAMSISSLERIKTYSIESMAKYHLEFLNSITINKDGLL